MMGLLPFTNMAYSVEIGEEPAARLGPTLPIEGCGAVIVDQNYGGPDNLIYTVAGGCAVSGAHIYIFGKAAFDAQGPTIDRATAVGRTFTTANGRWTQSIKLDAGQYTLLYEKPGEYGPDTVNLTVVDPNATLPQLAPAALPAPKPPQSKPTLADKKNQFWDI
jgi:hypothetical protein